MDEKEAEPSEPDTDQPGLYLPNSLEVFEFMLSTLRHSTNFHYYATHYGIGLKDPERPHDLVGSGNKYEWEVIRGLALMFREGSSESPLQELIYASRERHRKQYHHVKGNGDRPNPNATEEDMKVWALDTACAILENRPYDIPVHDYEEVSRRFNTFPEHKRKWAGRIIPKIRALPQPKLELITNLNDFPKIDGISDDIYDAIVERTRSAVKMLRERGYEFDKIICSEMEIPLVI